MTQDARRDTIFASAAILAGLAGLWLTWGYVPQARHFPQAMCAVILLSGIGILAGTRRATRAAGVVAASRESTVGDVGPDGTVLERPDAAAERAGLVRGALPFGFVLILWATAVSLGAGYLIPGFVAGVALMWIAGSRRPIVIVAGAAGTVLFCFTMFYIVFQTRIPETNAIKALVSPLRHLF